MTATMEQMVIQLQQELFTLKAQAGPDCSSSTGGQQSDHSPSSERCSESPQYERPGTSEGILCKEKDFQQWSKDTKAFFAGVMKESDCNEPGARSTKPGVCGAADAYSADGSHD